MRRTPKTSTPKVPTPSWDDPSAIKQRMKDLGLDQGPKLEGKVSSGSGIAICTQEMLVLAMLQLRYRQFHNQPHGTMAHNDVFIPTGTAGKPWYKFLRTYLEGIPKEVMQEAQAAFDRLSNGALDPW